MTVFINPASGVGAAAKIFETVEPILKEVGIKMETVETSSRGHACNFASQHISQQDCDGIICIGGDGLVHEVVNGLLNRSDAAIARHIPIGIIPAGTTNGLAHSLGIHSVEDAVMRIIKMRARPLDIIRLAPLDAVSKTPVYSVCSVDWGLSSQIDDSARSLRWLGRFKKYVATLYHLGTAVRIPTYTASLSFIPASTPPTQQQNPCDCQEQHCEACERPMQIVKGKRPDSDLKGWVVVDGEVDKLSFFVFGNTPRGLTPGAHLADGYVDLAIAEKCSRADLARLLLRNRSANNPHTRPPPHAASPATPQPPPPPEEGHVRHYKTSQFRLDIDPAVPLTVDGEVWQLSDQYETCKLQAEVQRGLCLAIC